jgi:hypothetical protein
VPAPDKPLPPGYSYDQSGNAVLAGGATKDAFDPDPGASVQAAIIRGGPTRDAADPAR